MNDTFDDQKEKLLAIKQEISLLHQQVNYLIRNEKALELLDLDVLMNRTHTLYDMLCSINIGEMADDEDLPFDAETISGLFGGVMQEEKPLAELEPEPEPEPEPEQKPEPEIVPEPESEPIPVPEPEPIEVVVPMVEPEPMPSFSTVSVFSA